MLQSFIDADRPHRVIYTRSGGLEGKKTSRHERVLHNNATVRGQSKRERTRLICLQIIHFRRHVTSELLMTLFSSQVKTWNRIPSAVRSQRPTCVVFLSGSEG